MPSLQIQKKTGKPKLAPLYSDIHSKISLIAGTPLEPLSYNITGNGKCECLKIKGLGNQQPRPV